MEKQAEFDLPNPPEDPLRPRSLKVSNNHFFEVLDTLHACGTHIEQFYVIPGGYLLSLSWQGAKPLLCPFLSEIDPDYVNVRRLGLSENQGA
jgi:hypothetical protein